MSSIRDQLGEDYENLNDILAPYIEELADRDNHLELKGKTIMTANREQPSWMSFYDERRIELSTYVKFFENEIQRVRSRALKSMETYPRELSDRSKEKYIDSNEEYLKVYEKFLAVRELYELYSATVEAFKQRGFALRNITNLKVAALDDDVL